MKLYAIGDLHLDGGALKPMNVFGDQWTDHFAKISRDWRARVTGDDLVLIPGDISWAMQLEDALPDLNSIDALPGRKVILRGNHDYWWAGIGRLRSVLPPNMSAIQNDALRVGPYTIAGSRGWLLPGPDTTAEDARIYQRELARLALSLDCARKLGGTLVVMTHYPPVGERGQPTEVSELIRSSGAVCCVYGHLHGAAGRNAFRGCLGDVRYACVSCDQLGFALHDLALEDPVGEDARKVESET